MAFYWFKPVKITAPERLGFLMLSFLFWNLKKLPRAEIVARLVHEHDVDVLMLAECSIPEEELKTALKKTTGREYVKPWSEFSKIHILTRLAEDGLSAVFDDVLGRLTVRRLTTTTQDILLAAVHFPAKVNWSEDEQRAELQNLAQDIVKIEDGEGHRRTILVGDFNMNPFEKGMISSHGLHAVMTRQIVKRKSRKVSGKEYPFFYNPMWGFFGDRTPGPAGTHFFRQPTPDMYFWNMFDQVLFRPDLLSAVRDEIRVIDRAGDTPLLGSNGQPDESIGSDHLPIQFSIHL